MNLTEKLLQKAKKESELLKAQGTVYDSKLYTSVNGFCPTADIVLMSIKDDELAVLMIKRKEYPYKGQWALPGGYAQADEDATILDSAKRELEEETGLKNIYLEELCSFTQKGRDPRELIANSNVRIITIAHIALIDHKKVNAVAQSDAEDVSWKTLSELKKMDLAFDHELIIQKAVDRVRGKLNYSNVGFELVDKKSFTIPELQSIFEKVLSKKLDRNNFRTKILKLGVLKELKEKKQDGPGKPAPYYTVDLNKLYNLQGKSLF
jgi:8-oxo-dGTP diphosphatase